MVSVIVTIFGTLGAMFLTVMAATHFQSHT